MKNFAIQDLENLQKLVKIWLIKFFALAKNFEKGRHCLLLMAMFMQELKKKNIKKSDFNLHKNLRILSGFWHFKAF